MAQIDTHLVKCPNGCHEPPNPMPDVTYGEPKQFLYWNGKVGTVNYCTDCGSEVECVGECDG